MSMIKLKDLISEVVPSSPSTENGTENVESSLSPNSHDTKTVSGQSFFLTNLRSEQVSIELKMTNGVAFVTVK